MKKQVATITARELISSPPKTELLCYGRLDQEIDGEYIVCEPSEVPSAGAYIACSLATNSSTVPLRILNVTSKEVRINKGQKVGIAVAAEAELETRGDEVSIRKINAHSDQWIKHFDTEHLDQDTKERLHELLHEYADLFLDEGALLPKASQVKHSL